MNPARIYPTTLGAEQTLHLAMNLLHQPAPAIPTCPRCQTVPVWAICINCETTPTELRRACDWRHYLWSDSQLTQVSGNQHILTVRPTSGEARSVCHSLLSTTTLILLFSRAARGLIPVDINTRVNLLPWPCQCIKIEAGSSELRQTSHFSAESGYGAPPKHF